jgi:hypothetical protein
MPAAGGGCRWAGHIDMFPQTYHRGVAVKKKEIAYQFLKIDYITWFFHSGGYNCCQISVWTWH